MVGPYYLKFRRLNKLFFVFNCAFASTLLDGFSAGFLILCVQMFDKESGVSSPFSYQEINYWSIRQSGGITINPKFSSLNFFYTPR